MYTNNLLSTDGSDLARKGVEHGLALAKALNTKVTVITVTDPLPVIEFVSGHAGGGISQQDWDVACKVRAGKVLDEARAMVEQIGISAELLHVPNAHTATANQPTPRGRPSRPEGSLTPQQSPPTARRSTSATATIPP